MMLVSFMPILMASALSIVPGVDRAARPPKDLEDDRWPWITQRPPERAFDGVLYVSEAEFRLMVQELTLDAAQSVIVADRFDAYEDQVAALTAAYQKRLDESGFARLRERQTKDEPTDPEDLIALMEEGIEATRSGRAPAEAFNQRLFEEVRAILHPDLHEQWDRTIRQWRRWVMLSPFGRARAPKDFVSDLDLIEVFALWMEERGEGATESALSPDEAFARITGSLHEYDVGLDDLIQQNFWVTVAAHQKRQLQAMRSDMDDAQRVHEQLMAYRDRLFTLNQRHSDSLAGIIADTIDPIAAFQWKHFHRRALCPDLCRIDAAEWLVSHLDGVLLPEDERLDDVRALWRHYAERRDSAIADLVERGWRFHRDHAAIIGTFNPRSPVPDLVEGEDRWDALITSTCINAMALLTEVERADVESTFREIRRRGIAGREVRGSIKHE